MSGILWVEPELGAVSGGLRYNQQVRSALQRRGVEAAALSLPVEAFDSGSGEQTVRAERRRLGAELVVLDGLIGSAHPQLFAGEDPAADVLLVHLPAALAQGLPENAAAAQRETQAAQAAKHVVTVSSWGAEQLRRHSPGLQVHVAPPGVEPAPEAAGLEAGRGASTASAGARRRASPDTGVTFACVAALNPLKNQALLGAALEPLLDSAWRLILAGPGAETPFGAHTLAELRRRLPGRVEHRGELTPQQVSRIWGETDVLVLPSLVETYGMVVAEACAHGVPAVVASGTGAVEAAGDAGAACDPRDPAQWTAALRDLLSSPRSLCRLQQRALDRRDLLPSWDAAAEVFLGLR
ncbi:glycosyltransferase family 4 protein [Nesterenkonia sp.]|uniref:glycosyltransferase family 4 protein n=1 Tax=Nesterenkonia sp. TaxID=704201 RepID=UPI00260A2AD5|nr:glycosyltransferase family 4 protein [Nesterenkonia sp.]